MNPKNELLPIQPGTAVRVSDGTPKPPARFNKKLADWESRNFDAIVVGEEAPTQWSPAPRYRLQTGDWTRTWIKMFTDRGADKVTPIEGAPTYIVEARGMDAEVTGVQA